MKDRPINISFMWNSEVKNLCEYDEEIGDYVYPLKEMKLSKMPMDESTFLRTLKKIYEGNLGRNDEYWQIGFDKGNDIRIAKKLGCWD